MPISKDMKEHIGVCYVSALDISPEVKILSTRRLLTLLSGAININNEPQYKKLIIEAINDCEKATAEYADDPDNNWGHACFVCNKILDKVTPMIYSGYGTISQTNAFSLQSIKNSPEVSK